MASNMKVTGGNDDTVGPWTCERRLGQGGFGMVRLWKHKENGKTLAIKVCRMVSEMTHEQRRRWGIEVEIMLKLDHPNVIRAVPLPEEFASMNYEMQPLAMEYCIGGDLRRVLMRPENCCGLKESAVRNLVGDIAAAVEYLHSMRIIHRDLKPENIVLQKGDDRDWIYKVIDLGYAKNVEQGSICTSFVGTVQYIAPELVSKQQYICTVDYWSFGILVFECITGFRPFFHELSPMHHLWQDCVKKKKDEVLYVYTNSEGKACYSKNLPSPNLLCRSTQYCLEKWLRLMLLWNARQRGGGLTPERRPKCFELLDTILSMKLIFIYSVPTNQLLSYRVDGETIETVQNIVQQETGIATEEQNLLLATGVSPEPNDKAAKYASDLDDMTGLVFLLKKYKSNTADVPIRRKVRTMPTAVSTMIQEPNVMYTYPEQKQAWAHAVYFCNEVAGDLKRLQHAHRAVMMNLLRTNSWFSKTKQKMVTECEKVLAKAEFFKVSVRIDLDKYEAQTTHGIRSQKLHTSWRKSEDLPEQATVLGDKVHKLDQECSALSTKVVELQRSPFSKVNNVLDTLAQRAIKCFEELRQNHNDRQKPDFIDNKKMVDVVMECFREKDTITKNIYEHILKVSQCHSEMQNLLPEMEGHMNLITELSNKLLASNRQRQHDIWTLIKILNQNREDNSEEQGAPSTNEQNDNEDKSQPQPLQSPLEASSMTATTQALFAQMQMESSRVVQESKELHQLSTNTMSTIQYPKTPVATFLETTDLSWLKQ